LANATVGIVYIGPVPEKVYGDVPTHRLLWQLDGANVADFRIKDLPTGPFNDNYFFAKTALPSTATFINPIDLFCSKLACSLGRDYQFYSDSHHLNFEGSKKLKAAFEDVL
jgi:hypothetical protein